MVNPDMPVLVVDFGTTFSVANLIDGGRVRFVTDELSGDRAWPTSIYRDPVAGYVVGDRAEQRKHESPQHYQDELKVHLTPGATLPLGETSVPVRDLIAEFLGVLRTEAQTMTAAPVTRILVTIPGAWHPGSARRAELYAACRAAGFHEVEMLYEPVAAAYAPQTDDEFEPDDLILVYDMGGGSFDLALVRLGRTGGDRIPAHGIADQAGRQIDQALAAVLAESTTDTVADREGQLELLDIARRLKCRLSAESEATAPRSWLGSGLRLTEAHLKAAASDLIDGTIEVTLSFLENEGRATTDLDGVLLVGGGARMSLVQDAVTDAFRPVPVRRPGNPEFAVIDGATRWRQAADERRVTPAVHVPGEIPLRWPVPGDLATISRWLVDPGQSYDAGTPLVRVALTDGAHWELCATKPGTLRQQHGATGTTVRSGDWLVTALAERPSAGTGLITPYRWRSIPIGNATVSVTPDFRWAACRHSGNRVDLIDLTTGDVRPLWRAEDKPVLDVGIDRTGSRVAITQERGVVHVVEVASGTQRTETFEVGAHTRATFSPTDDLLAVSATDGTRLYLCAGADLTGTPVDLPYNSYTTTRTAWSPDGTWLLPAGHHITPVSVQNGPLPHHLRSNNVFDAVFLDSEHVLTITGNERVIRKYGLQSGTEVSHLTEATNPVRIVSDRPRDLIATCDGKLVRLSQPDGTGRGHVTLADKVIDMAMSPDSYRLLVTTETKIVIYGLDTAALAAE